MKNYSEFRIDKWTQNATPDAKIILHGSAVGAISLSELQGLAAPMTANGVVAETPEGPVDSDLVLTYGDVRGSHKLRERIAELHSSDAVKFTADNVIITPGSITANYLALANIAGPGDHVICQYPTFPQLHLVPRYQGAEVSLWKMKAGTDVWDLRMDELEGLIKPNTTAIIINNPNNPVGLILHLPFLQTLVQLVASKHPHITLYSDEVFSPLFHDQSFPSPPNLVSLGHPKTVSVGSMSKSMGLPGIRIGWVISPDLNLLERVMTARDYTTLSVSQLDDGVAVYALSPAILPALIRRNLDICAVSIGMIKEFLERNEGRGVEWVCPPQGAGTAFLRVLENDDGNGNGGKPVDDKDFAGELLKETGVSVVPGGYCFGEEDGDDDLKGFIRISLGAPREKLAEGLQRLEVFLCRRRVGGTKLEE
ncbi:pyridoxal phosphate-dependent transferase [Podospora didyma]|uniref:Pyridoxal phosphate-dependent transferase n=1 Tax=Podospora didyma TaxID=330526 RepID=A0AAE0KJS8_9PEZI|nr:pyridoxal phosphate-dependent transferase [Podospora didyma]